MPAPIKDTPTVRADGSSLQPLIDGVVVRYQLPQTDERGEVVEVYRESWNVLDEPLVYVYQVSIMPGMVKGWVVHYQQEDRLFLSQGRLRFVFFDARDGSRTFHLLNVFTITERNRALLVIPRGVYHAVQNVGSHEAFMINMPTRAYDHGNPDKHRLPLVNDLIPFDFTQGRTG